MTTAILDGDGLEQALLDMDRASIHALAAEVGSSAVGFAELELGLAAALTRIGEGWARGELALSQVYVAGRLAEELLEGLPSLGPSAPRAAGPKVAVAALDDHHLLGKRLVLASLRVAGVAAEDWGVFEDPRRLAERAHAEHVDVLLLSTLMLRAAHHVRDVVLRLRALGATTRVGVGGAPYRLDPALAERVLADGTAANATDAPRLVAELTGRTP
ncbi:cobalamin-dependent protein [Myxococcota bacterium]|nr:cobalamin-dependent protein [Myxococcota bacterium]